MRANRRKIDLSTLVLLRHGQSQWNLENRFTGWVDVPLTEQGRAEAKRAGELLKAAGLCDTGGMAQAVTTEGLVSVDGTVERRKRCKIRPGQVVTFQSHTVTVA